MAAVGRSIPGRQPTAPDPGRMPQPARRPGAPPETPPDDPPGYIGPLWRHKHGGWPPDPWSAQGPGYPNYSRHVLLILLIWLSPNIPLGPGLQLVQMPAQAFPFLGKSDGTARPEGLIQRLDDIGGLLPSAVRQLGKQPLRPREEQQVFLPGQRWVGKGTQPLQRLAYLLLRPVELGVENHLAPLVPAA